MQQTLSDHIANLEKRILILRKALREQDLTTYQKAERELALANAEQALNLFRTAYDVEQRVPKVDDISN